MNREDIIRMADEAGLLPCYEDYYDDIERFARLIAEDCATRCEQLFDPDDDSCTEAETCAAAIREAYKP